MPVRGRSCEVCGRSKVALIYVVWGRVWLPSGWPWVKDAKPRRRSPENEAYMSRLPVLRRTRAQCLFTAECTALWEARAERQRTRSKLPDDAVLRELQPGRRGWCRWCGQLIYQRDPDGHVRPNRTGRMWHDGRVVHPDAEPEPRCVQEYHAQGWSFRDQVFKRDGGVCAGCGRDCEAERRAWLDRTPGASFDDASPEGRAWFALPWEEREMIRQAWMAEEPDGWDADHIVPLEDGGEHTLANAQTLCKPCHAVKTGRENSERAARRRAA